MFRDKKSLAMMLIIPLMIPLLIVGMSALFDRELNKPITDYNTIGFDYELSYAEKSIVDKIGIEVVLGTKDELKNKYDNYEVDLYVTKSDNNYTINGNDSGTTTYASTLVNAYFDAYKQYLQTEYLSANKVNAEEVLNIITLETNLTQEDNYFVNYITVYAFLFIIMAITISATYPATDTTAGEKERGTLETLLTFPIKSRDIIVGKFLGVSFSSIVTGLISLVLMLGSLAVPNRMFDIYKGVNLMLPVSSVIYALVVIIAYSFLISGLCIAIASTSKTFKEAQSALTPLTFVSFFPSMIVFMINIKTTPLLAMIPFLNYIMLFTDITNGTVDYLNIGLMVISTIAVISIVLAVIIKQYKSEKVLFI